MSVAIVAMVNQTALPKDPTVPDDECGVDSVYKNSSAETVSTLNVKSSLITYKAVCLNKFN